MKIFLGSSGESKELMRKVAVWLEDEGHEPIPWDEDDTFEPGEYTWDTLASQARQVGAAAFVFGTDDKVWYRERAEDQPRDNVLVEYGLFAGMLGRRNTLVCRRGKAKVPTDLAGLNLVPIDRPHRARIRIAKWAASLQTGKQRSHHLQGTWETQWLTTTPAEEYEPVDATARLTVATDGTLRGRSDIPGYGPCHYRGHEHDFVVSFSYRGEGAAKELIGGVVLQKQPGRDVLAGHWVQFTSRNLVASGSTVWSKQTQEGNSGA